MGIPKFFRFISERYPCISEPIKKDSQICDFDYLYLDMNGIFHICSHPDDANAHFRITEEQIWRDIFHYISYLFQLINPKKGFFMAVDGVAPRAKMNQQRSRRFQSARDDKEVVQKALDRGEILPPGPQFDSNCITTGTIFMARLHEQLRYFIKHKISTDRTWAKCKIIFSGHETPGEGEHKIMDYIRYIRSQPDHDPNTRHCLYGLDADLIMLGFCSHEPNFSILREEVKFNRRASSIRPSTPDENNFYLLHLSLLKDYIEQEFFCLKTCLSFGYDINKIIDDWILMGFLVGNDFIPSLPNLAINKNALPELYEIYKSVLPTLDGYINENGVLNLARFQVYMKKLAELDKRQFEETYADTKYLESKQTKKSPSGKIEERPVTIDDMFGPAIEFGTVKPFKSDLELLIEKTDKLAMDTENDDLVCREMSDDENKDYDSSEEMFNTEFALHKRHYYMEKLNFPEVTAAVLKSQAEGYVRAIQWVLHYYYQGCSSWSWFYPFHYSPYLSDITNFADIDLSFEIGTPFKPFEQLLAVLPSASKELLPEAFHHLMTSEDSPIIEYYPLEFETDLNGKIQQWEAVVLIPFINEVALLSAMESCYEHLTDDEKKRNKHGPMLIYEYCSESSGSLCAPAYFTSLKECHALEKPVWVREILLPPDKVIRGSLPNPHKDAFFPGVPKLTQIDFKSEFTKARVRVFDMPSRNESAILRVNYNCYKEKSLESIASDLLGKIIWVGWPYIVEAKVMAVSNDAYKISYSTEGYNSKLENDVILSYIKDELRQHDKWKYTGEKNSVINHYMNRLGIDVGEVQTYVHAITIQGYKYITGAQGKLSYGITWCPISVSYPLQTILTDVTVAPVAMPKLYQTLEEAFPKGENVFIILGPYYGSKAEILNSNEVNKTGRLKVSLLSEPEPVLKIPNEIAVDTYMDGRIAAAKCGMSFRLFSRITASVYVTPKGKIGSPKKYDKNVDIGLNVKSTKNNQKLLGFTNKKDKFWQYSFRCVELVTSYICQFFDMIQKLELAGDGDLTEFDIIYNDDYNINDVVNWINGLPYKKYPWYSCETEGLDPEEMKLIEDTVNEQAEYVESQKKTLEIKVKPHVLFKGDLRSGNIPPDPALTRFRLFDRVVNISPNCSVPLGYKGTIVSIVHKNDNSVKILDNINQRPLYLVQFDKVFPSGSKVVEVDGARFYLMHSFNLLNITDGQEHHNKTNNKVAINSTYENRLNSFNFLRSNDGHNSAFANYTSPTKARHENISILEKDSPNRFNIMPSFLNNQNPANVQKLNTSSKTLDNNPEIITAQNLPIKRSFEPPQLQQIFSSANSNQPSFETLNNHFMSPIVKSETLPPMFPQSVPVKHSYPESPQIPTMHLNINRGLPNFQPSPLQHTPNANFMMSPNQPFNNFGPTMNPFIPQFGITSPTGVPSNAEDGTMLLRSLLKIEEPLSPSMPPNKINLPAPDFRRHNSYDAPTQSQEFYKTPPNKTQLPFPAKLINDQFNNQNASMNPTQQANYKISTPFVPLQVTKKTILQSNQSQEKDENVNNVSVCDEKILEITENEESLPVDQQVQQPPKKNLHKKNNRKSRVAANFNV